MGVGDVLIGAAALAADYNGAARASHIKDKLIEMMHLNETLYACGIACSAEGFKTASGTYLINLLLANVCKQNVTRFPYEIPRLAEDLAGGLMVTMPSEKDLRHPEIGSVIEKYLRGSSAFPTEHRMRILRLIENITLGTAAGGAGTGRSTGKNPSAWGQSKGTQRVARVRSGVSSAISDLRQDVGLIIIKEPVRIVWILLGYVPPDLCYRLFMDDS